VTPPAEKTSRGGETFFLPRSRLFFIEIPFPFSFLTDCALKSLFNLALDFFFVKASGFQDDLRLP